MRNPGVSAGIEDPAPLFQQRRKEEGLLALRQQPLLNKVSSHWPAMRRIGRKAVWRKGCGNELTPRSGVRLLAIEPWASVTGMKRDGRGRSVMLSLLYHAVERRTRKSLAAVPSGHQDTQRHSSGKAETEEAYCQRASRYASSLATSTMRTAGFVEKLAGAGQIARRDHNAKRLCAR